MQTNDPTAPWAERARQTMLPGVGGEAACALERFAGEGADAELAQRRFDGWRRRRTQARAAA